LDYEDILIYIDIKNYQHGMVTTMNIINSFWLMIYFIENHKWNVLSDLETIERIIELILLTM
jgi:hypothetical protein